MALLLDSLLSPSGGPDLDSKSQFAELAALARDSPGRFFENGDDAAVRVLRKIVTFLNDESASFKTKLTALLVLADVARLQRRRRVVARAIKGLDVALEIGLEEKVKGRARFGTALGKHHQLLLVLFSRISGYRLDADSLLELVNGDVALSLELVCGCLKVRGYEDGILLSLCNVLNGLVQPMMPRDEDVSTFTSRANKVLALTMAPDVAVFDAIAAAFKDRCFQSDAQGPLSTTLQSAIVAALSFTQGLYLHATLRTADLRQHLLVSTSLAENLLVPFIEMSTEHSPALLGLLEKEGGEAACSFTHDPLLLRSLSLALKILVLLNFRATRYRCQSRRNNIFTPRLLLAHAFLCTHPSIFALLLLYNVNIDSLSEDSSDGFDEDLPPACRPKILVSEFEGALRNVGAEAAGAVRDLVHYPRNSWLPVSRDLPSWDVLLKLLDSFNETDNEEKQHEGKCQLSESGTATIKERTKEIAECEEVNRVSATTDGASVERGTHTPVHLQTLEINPPMGLSVPKRRSSRKRRSRKLKSSSSSAGRLYGDTGGQLGNAELKGGAPDAFKCAINGHILKEPMRSPHGHVFERVTIETWLQKLGSVCPITGKPLCKSDLVLDRDLQARICSWHVQRTLALQSTHKDVAQISDDDGDALYDF